MTQAVMDKPKKALRSVLWSDDFHYVRAATIKEVHQMRFVVMAKRGSESPFRKRHAPTLPAGIEIAEAATARLLCARPELIKLDESPVPVFAQPPAIKPIKFVVTRFVCIRCNSVAQVWQCHLEHGEKKIGRPRRDGADPVQADFPHVPGEFAVTMGEDVVMDGALPRVFKSWQAAEEYAADLYHEADEEDQFAIDQKIVHQTRRIDVLFDPEEFSIKKPFGLWMPEFSKHIYEDRTAAISRPRSDISNLSTQDQIDIEAARRRADRHDRKPTLESVPLTFRSLPAAIEEAERRERMMQGLSR